MRTGILSILLFVVLGVGFIRSGDYGQQPAKASGGSAALRRPIEVLDQVAKCRRVKHPLGEAQVPLQPQRIVSLSPAVTDTLVALGIRPVMVESAWKSAEPVPYLAAGLKGTLAVRRAGGISIEAVMDAAPDLVLIGSLQDGKMYGPLSKVAPTVVFNTIASRGFESTVLDIADVMGVPGRARQRLAEYHQRIVRAKATLAARAGNQPVVFLRFRQHTCVIYAQKTMFGPLLFEQLGLTADPAMPLAMSPGGWDVFSVERLSTLRSAHIFTVVDADSKSYYDYITGTSIWKKIPAVRTGQVHSVAATTWLGGEGILANEAIVHDVLAAMAPEGTP